MKKKKKNSKKKKSSFSVHTPNSERTIMIINNSLLKKKNKTKTLLIIISIILLIIIFVFSFVIKHKDINVNKNNYNESKIIYENKNIAINNFSNTFNFDFEYHNYERDFITDKMKKNAGWQLQNNEPYFLNGIIRKFKPKKCLEIGVARGGSSIIILNAIKDIKDSFLISLDLNIKFYGNNGEETGYNVKRHFPELTENNKWKLFTGEQPNIFLDRLNLTYDFLFLDTVHLTPGELINIIEALPFLEENAIVVLHDIVFHLLDYHIIPEVKYFPSQIYLMTSLAGNKVAIQDKYYGTENIGAIFLHPHQETYYLNYFFLLLSPWEYMPTDKQIDELRSFISKYYKEEIYLKIFDTAVKHAKIYSNKVDRFKIAYGLTK